MSNPTICTDPSLYHNNDVQTMANVFFKLKDETVGKLLMMLFNGTARLQEWVNAIIALRNITEDNHLKTDEFKSLALKVKSSATTVLQTTRPC